MEIREYIRLRADAYLPAKPVQGLKVVTPFQTHSPAPVGQQGAGVPDFDHEHMLSVRASHPKPMEELLTAVLGVNTAAAEQCFADLRMISPTLRRMGVWSSRLFLAFRVYHRNGKMCRHNEAEVSPQGPISSRWMPCETLGSSLHYS